MLFFSLLFFCKGIVRSSSCAKAPLTKERTRNPRAIRSIYQAYRSLCILGTKQSLHHSALKQRDQQMEEHTPTTSPALRGAILGHMNSRGTLCSRITSPARAHIVCRIRSPAANGRQATILLRLVIGAHADADGQMPQPIPC